MCAHIEVVGDFTVLTHPVPDMTTDDAAVDAGRLADSHTEILLADVWLIARIQCSNYGGGPGGPGPLNRNGGPLNSSIFEGL